ncbi:MAG: hypothetical protein AAFP84_20270 [Actinomycetota bacterium]
MASPDIDADAIVRDAFEAAAPKLADEFAALDPDADVWVSLQLDSMEHLSVMEHLSRSIDRDIPERDYPQLLTLAAIRRYVTSSPGCASG